MEHALNCHGEITLLFGMIMQIPLLGRVFMGKISASSEKCK